MNKSKTNKKREKKAARAAADKLAQTVLADDLELEDQNGMFAAAVYSVRDWVAMTDRLSKPATSDKLQKLMGRPDGSPLLWMICPEVCSGSVGEEVQSRWKKPKGSGELDTVIEIVRHLLEDISESKRTRVEAILALANVYALPRIANKVQQTEFESLVSLLLRFEHEHDLITTDDPWLVQLLRIELPLVLCYLLPKEKALVSLARVAMAEMSSLISQSLDSDGMPAAVHISDFGPLCASWARTWAMISKLGFEFEFEAVEQLEWAVRQSLRMLRPNGSFVLGSNAVVDRPFAKLLIKMSSDNDDARIAARCLPDPPSKKNAASKKDIVLDASSSSEWGEAALMQTYWERYSPKCAVTFNDRSCKIDICAAVDLFHGQCMPIVTLNGSQLSPVDEFEMVCWHSDDRADYLELEIELEQGVVLQRQFILARDGEFAYVGDVIVPPEAGEIGYECEFPLANGISVLEETETREVYLQDPKIRSLVLPLSLGEWKVAEKKQFLKERDGKLVLKQTQKGRGLFAGLFIDLNSERSLRPRTWRQLTVAQALQPVPQDVAVAFRVQIGSGHWVFYRVVTESGNRTFLGENYNDDFFVGEFDTNGDVRELIAIE